MAVYSTFLRHFLGMYTLRVPGRMKVKLTKWHFGWEMSEGIFNDKQMQSDKGRERGSSPVWKRIKITLFFGIDIIPFLCSLLLRRRGAEIQNLRFATSWKFQDGVIGEAELPLKSQIIERLSLLDHLLLHPYIWSYRVNQQVLISRSKTYVCIFWVIQYNKYSR